MKIPLTPSVVNILYPLIEKAYTRGHRSRIMYSTILYHDSKENAHPLSDTTAEASNIAHDNLSRIVHIDVVKSPSIVSVSLRKYAVLVVEGLGFFRPLARVLILENYLYPRLCPATEDRTRTWKSL